MKKLSALTIILLVLSVYLSGLSFLEYLASVKAEKSADEVFSMGQNRSSESLMNMLNQNYVSVESNEWKIAENENKIINLQNEVTNNWWMDMWIDWRMRAKMHFYMGLIALLTTILSWKIDHLTKK